MTQEKVLRACIAVLTGLLLCIAYTSEARAADSSPPGVPPAFEAQAAPPAEAPTPGPALATEPPAQQPASASSVSGKAPGVKPVAPAGAPSVEPPVKPLPVPAPQPSGPPTLTWLGITLYGVVDVGLAYLSHGAPPSSTYGPGLPYIVQNFSNGSVTSIANNGLSQSKIGLSGIEPLHLSDLQAVFKLETGFQPATGRLTDGPKSLVANNGRANADKVTAGDSSRAGQPFQGAAFAGLSSAMLGTLSFGRQPSLMADDLMKYDPQLQSQAFSPIGYSGAAGGLGNTEDKILDNSLKYIVVVGPVHLAALYQFGKAGYLPGGSESVDFGADLAGFSVDFLWGRVHGAVSASSLTAAQSAAAPGTLAATVSDNTAYAAMLRYAFRALKLYAAYEHITYANPKDPLPVGTATIGDYVLSVVNNTAFTLHKVLHYAWAGARFSITPSLDVSAAYYQFRQNSYNANGCSDNSAGSCSGLFHDGSFVVDYKLSLRFDTYAGVNYSRVMDGMAAGFINDHNWSSVLGLRFKL